MGFNEATRIQSSLLARAEKRALNWLGQHMPRSVNSDHLTLLGLLSMLLGGISYALAARWPVFLLVVNLFLFLNWFGDSLDGTVARLRNRLRPRYGFYVDHICDAFGAIFIVTGLVLSGYISGATAAILLVSFLMLSLNSYLEAYSVGTFRLSIFKFGPTEIRVLLGLLNGAAFFYPSIRLFDTQVWLFDILGLLAGLAMALILGFSAIRNTIYLYNLEKVDNSD